MARCRRRGKGSRSAQPNTVHPDAAGLDVGATAVYAAVRPQRDPDPIRNFSTFTGDLHALANWLKECQVTTVAMESTGVYWIPVHQILDEHGFDVVLVNARHVHSVPGRKSDVADCEWLRYLHSVGLLHGSFRPADEVCAVAENWASGRVRPARSTSGGRWQQSLAVLGEDLGLAPAIPRATEPRLSDIRCSTLGLNHTIRVAGACAHHPPATASAWVP